MKPLRSWPWQRLLPIVLTIVGLWGLAGCLYLPIPEHRVDGKQKDFSKMFSPGNPSSAIRPGVTREQLFAMLGRPAYVSDDHKTAAYFLDTESGVWIWPLCAAIYPDHRHVRALIVSFGADERISEARIDEDDQDVSIFRYNTEGTDWSYLHHDPFTRATPKTQPATTQPAT